MGDFQPLISKSSSSPNLQGSGSDVEKRTFDLDIPKKTVFSKHNRTNIQMNLEDNVRFTELALFQASQDARVER